MPVEIPNLDGNQNVLLSKVSAAVMLDLAYGDEAGGRGVVSGLEASPTAGTLGVYISAGSFTTTSGLKEFAGGSIALDAADSASPRIDIIEITGTPSLSKVTGTPDADPVEPMRSLISEGQPQYLKVAAVLVEANDTEVSPSGILDRRIATDYLQTILLSEDNIPATGDPNTSGIDFGQFQMYNYDSAGSVVPGNEFPGRETNQNGLYVVANSWAASAGVQEGILPGTRVLRKTGSIYYEA